MMQPWKHKRSSVPISILALLALLLLATLQYYWVGQVSEGARESMGASLRAGVTRFSEDFDRELARAYLSLQMDAATLRDKEWQDYARRYDHWFATAPYPQMVGEIFLVEVYENGRLHLSHLDTDTKRFASTDWPPSLLGLQQRLERSAKTTHTEGELVVGDAPAPVVEEIPALVIPLAHMSLLSDQSASNIDVDVILGDTVFTYAPRRMCARCYSAVSAGPLFAYTIVTLDRAYLRQTFIPALARHYFASDTGTDYNLTIVSRDDPTHVFYQSDPHAAVPEPGAGDATVDLLNVRLDEFNRLLLDDAMLQGDAAHRDDRRSLRIAIGTMAGAAPGQAADGKTPPGETASGNWRLILTHRAGSLDAAIASLRLRDLLISLGILVLLVGSMALMVISTRRAQRLAQQKIEFVAAISHELRTPLAVICSAGENLADGVVHEPQRARQYGTVIHREGRRLTEMVEQALEFAGARSGRQTYELRPVEIGPLVESALVDFYPRLREECFQVEQMIQPDLPLVMADAAALRRSIQNLLSNAIKYSGERRWIGLCVCTQTSKRGQELRISVQDRGIGIAPADLPHIFEPFYRGRDVIAAQIHGSGLGLNLIKQIIEGHHGDVSVESTPGQGSTFTLHIPVPLRTERVQQAVRQFGNT